MSRMLKPVATGLAVSSLCFSLVADLAAQSATKKKSPIKPVQALDEEDDKPRARPRTPPVEDVDADDEPEPPPRAKSAKLARPQAQVLRVPNYPPELEKVLQDWEKQTSQFKKLAGGFTRFKYDRTFEVEIRAVGKFAYEAPDKGNYELRGAEFKKGDVSTQKGKDGTPYKLESASAERWVCNGKEIIRINEKDRNFEKVPIPPESQGEKIIDGPLPFLFGMKAERAKKRYESLKLLKNTDTDIWLEVHPRMQEDAANWSKAVVMIKAKTYLPKAVKLFLPDGGETVHVFDNLEINDGSIITQLFRANPFKPNLFGYKPILTKSALPATGEKPMPPAGSKQSGIPSAKGRGSQPDGDVDRNADVSAADPPRKKAGTPVNRN